MNRPRRSGTRPALASVALVAVALGISASRAAAEPALLDVNRATKGELMVLPGVSAPVAERIVAGRPYGSKASLLTTGAVSEAVYLAIRNLVVARQGGAAVSPPRRP